ncbi:MAG: DUF115 domain-containing protein [Alphaproteobacteria bacterium]
MADPVSLEKNVDVLRDILSGDAFHALTSAPADNVELISGDREGGPNIATASRRLYQPDGQHYAEDQVRAFLESPKRLSLAPAPPTSAAAFSEMAVARLYGRFSDRLIRDDRDPSLAAGYLVSLGLGLGLHLPMLLDALPVRNIVIVEQSPAIVRLSLAVLDWAGMAEELERRGGRLHLFIAGNPQTVSARIYETMRGDDMPFLDGSVIFPHYATSYLNEVAGAFATALPMIGDPVGFLEDEALMLRNTAANLKAEPDGILRPGSGTGAVSPVPAFIVGSGPSIDSQIDTIAKHRNDALVISGGTGLSVLLENGITPDLHCEIENVPDIYAAILQCAARHDLSALTLVGSVTVDPRVPPFFGWFLGVFRDVLSSTRAFADGYKPLEMAGPTVTNLACRTAIAAGCSEIYLFGTDLGSIDPEKHHSDGSLYAYSDDPYWQSGAQMESLSIPAAGNFRETVYTSREFLFTKLYFDTLTQNFPAVAFRNCSDGMRIAGAIPFEAQAVALPSLQPSVKQALLDGLSEPWRQHDEIDGVLATIRQALAGAAVDLQFQARGLSGESDLSMLAENLKPFLHDGQMADGDELDAIARFMMSGSVMMIVLAANSLLGRVGPDDRQAVIDAMLAEIEDFAGSAVPLFDSDGQDG